MPAITPSQKDSIRKKMFSTPVLDAFKQAHLTKDDVVKQFSNNRTTHIGELDFVEAVELNSYLYAIQQQAPPDPRDKQRKAVIAICRSCGWEKFVRRGRSDAKIIADMPRINAWVEKHFKGSLNSLSTQELSKVIVAAENMKASTDKAIINATDNK
jgi:hypothetical protein